MEQATIYVVDDDPAVRRTLTVAAPTFGVPVQAYSSGMEFLGAFERSRPGCLVLDVEMPGMSGLELQSRLAQDGVRLPIVFLSSHANVRTAVEAMSRGAVTLLEKPFRLEELTTHVRRALEQDADLRQEQSKRASLEAQLALLTAKEREVLRLLGAGKTNKQIAGELNLSIRAVEDRRSRLMKKLGVRSLAELIPWQSLLVAPDA